MRRGPRIFYTALALSALAHLISAGSTSRWWSEPAREIAFPIQARLNLAAEPGVSPVSRPAVQQAEVNKPTSAAEVAAVPPPDSVVPDSPHLPQVPVALPAPPVEVPQTEQPSEPAAPLAGPAPVVAAPPARVARDLPERIALRYSVQSGEDGLVLGQTTYSGQVRDGRYSLVSVTEATGITALFVSGKIIQTSEGRVTAQGLQPELFLNRKGERKQSLVRFDWARQRLLLSAGEVELLPETQDLMSFPFHLAMLVHEGDAAWSLPVTNGKKLREYGFRVIGRAPLTTGNTRVETLHLQGGRNGEGSLDVWLSPARQWLPVRIRTLDQKGKVIVLTLQDAAG